MKCAKLVIGDTTHHLQVMIYRGRVNTVFYKQILNMIREKRFIEVR